MPVSEMQQSVNATRTQADLAVEELRLKVAEALIQDIEKHGAKTVHLQHYADLIEQIS